VPFLTKSDYNKCVRHGLTNKKIEKRYDMVDHMIETLLEVVEKARKIRKHSGVEYIDWREVSEMMGKRYP